MKIVTPLDTIAGGLLTDTNVTAESITAWSAGTINLGQQRIYANKIYEVIADPNTTDRPDVGAAKETPTWLDQGYTNPYRMFDRIISSKSIEEDEIEVEITPAEIINAMALFGLVGQSVQIVVDDPVEGVVYDETFDLQDSSNIVDWYSYFFEEVRYREELAVLDLPAYPDAVITVTIANPGDDAECGELLIGRQRDLGLANFGTSVGIQNYSVKTTDDFGNVTIVPRAFAKRADFDVSVQTSEVYIVQRWLAEIRNIPTLFIGDVNRTETLVYGYWRDWTIVLSNPAISDCSLEVEGLV
jgi:hypothetical protein